MLKVDGMRAVNWNAPNPEAAERFYTEVLGGKVVVLKGGARLKTGHVFCSARFEGRKLKVLARRLRAGAAVCAWRVPTAARGRIVSAAIVVQQGRLRGYVPFRAGIS